VLTGTKHAHCFQNSIMERAMRFEPTTLTLASARILFIYLILNEIYVANKHAREWTRAELSDFTRQLLASSDSHQTTEQILLSLNNC